MTDKQPEALKLADDLDACSFGPNKIAQLLRTQHADLLRKDALLRQVLAAYEQDEGLAMGRVIDLITKELQ